MVGGAVCWAEREVKGAQTEVHATGGANSNFELVF